MATWHQQQVRNRKHYHDTLWTVLTDPPNACTTAMLWPTEHEAHAYIERLRVHHPHEARYSLVLKPGRIA